MPNVWLFQANPSKYRILESLTREKQEYWNLNQHGTEISKGDTVLIWLCGPDAGIYARGRVLTNPVSRRDSDEGIEYWMRRQNGLRVKPRVLVSYNKKFLNRPILKVMLESVPELWGLEVIRQPRGTNYSVSNEEWRALQRWIN